MSIPCLKLVRDYIGEELKGRKDVTIIKVRGDELELMLRVKVLEEAIEFVLRPTLEEVVDIFEALYSWLKMRNLDLNRLEELRRTKLRLRGGFKEGYVAIWHKCDDVHEFFKLRDIESLLKELHVRILSKY